MKESRLYSFIDNKAGFTLHFLEGTKLIKDLEVIHNIGPHALEYYRKTVLTAQQMITFLKPGENIGVYIDSDEPYFRFKIEMNFNGSMRTLLLPEEFNEFPNTLNGMARISKIFTNTEPYTSIVKMHNDQATDVINIILKESYQTNSKVMISETLDQSIMFTKLPRVDIKRVIEDLDDIPMDEFVLEKNKIVQELFKKHTDDIEIIVNSLEDVGFSYLSSKEIKFNCPCSKERMLTNVMMLNENDRDHVFEEKAEIEIRCDYCNTTYSITKEDTLKN